MLELRTRTCDPSRGQEQPGVLLHRLPPSRNSRAGSLYLRQPNSLEKCRGVRMSGPLVRFESDSERIERSTREIRARVDRFLRRRIRELKEEIEDLRRS